MATKWSLAAFSLIVGLTVSGRLTFAAFTARASMTNNTFTTAAVFPLPSPSTTPHPSVSPTPSPSGINIVITGNGSGSNSTVSVTNQTHCTTNQTNTTNIANLIQQIGLTGGNILGSNTATGSATSSAIIQTGNINQTVTIINQGSTNTGGC